jgi:hypothetical protein
MVLYFSLDSLLPNLRIPVPASTTIRSPLLARISKHVVSPPYFKYSFPETGMEPRDPQHLMYIGILSKVYPDKPATGGQAGKVRIISDIAYEVI